MEEQETKQEPVAETSESVTEAYKTSESQDAETTSEDLVNENDMVRPVENDTTVKEESTDPEATSVSSSVNVVAENISPASPSEVAQGDSSKEASTSEEVEEEEITPGIQVNRPGMKWYVVHTYSGFEAKAKKALLDRAAKLTNGDMFGDILVPSENVVEMVQGKKRTSSRKFFPGYILVQMNLTDDVWHIVKGTPKVTGFVGSAKTPPAVPESEIQAIADQMSEGAKAPKLKMTFETGESVRVIDGPFQNFNGLVDDVKPDKGKLTVLVSIFGRSTPVELDFVQVEKN